MPLVDLYDGTSFLLDHLESCKSMMMIQEAFDALLCIFPTTLRKTARVWYSRLELRSIHSFKQLVKFVAYFSASQRMPKEPDSFSIRQQKRELLKDYVAQFKSAMLEIYNLDGP